MGHRGCVWWSEDDLKELLVSSHQGSNSKRQVMRLAKPSCQQVQADLEVTLQIKLVLTSWSPYLRLPNSWITGLYHQVQFWFTLSYTRPEYTRLPSNTRPPPKPTIKIPFSKEVPRLKGFFPSSSHYLDLLDLSEPVSQTQTKAKKSEPSSKSSSLKKKSDGSDLISADAEQRAQALRGPETSSLDLGKAKVCSSYGLTLSCWCW